MGDLAPQGARIPAPDQAPHETGQARGRGRTAWAQVPRRTAHSQRPGPYGRAWDHVAWRGTSGLCRPAGPAAAHDQEAPGPTCPYGVGSGSRRLAGPAATAHGQRLDLYGEGLGARVVWRGFRRVPPGRLPCVARAGARPVRRGPRARVVWRGFRRVPPGRLPCVARAEARPVRRGPRARVEWRGLRFVPPGRLCGLRAEARPVRPRVSGACRPATALVHGCTGRGPARTARPSRVARESGDLPSGTGLVRRAGDRAASASGSRRMARNPARATRHGVPVTSTASPHARPTYPPSRPRAPGPTLPRPGASRRTRLSCPPPGGSAANGGHLPRGSPHLCHPTCTGGAGGNRPGQRPGAPQAPRTRTAPAPQAPHHRRCTHHQAPT